MAEIHTLYETNANDIPGMLRASADAIEQEGGTKAIVAVQIDDEGGIALYGWGEISTPETFWALACAQKILLED